MSFLNLNYIFNTLPKILIKKTIATLTTGGQNVFQKGCLSQCTDTGRTVNGQILGVFCCNTTLCNTVAPISNFSYVFFNFHSILIDQLNFD